MTLVSGRRRLLKGYPARALTDATVKLIVTTGSGDGQALAVARRLQEALAARECRVELRTFGDLPSLVRWTRRCEPTSSYLLCVGGDSTQSAAARAALRLSVPLVPVPSGFGNMFARAFGHRNTPAAVIALLERGPLRHVDVGQVGDDLFLSHRSYGPLQEIEATVEPNRNKLRARVLRSLAYYVAAGRHLAGSSLPSIRVQVDGGVVTEDAAMVTVANVETYRGYLNLTPGASPSDGLLDVFALPRTTAGGFLSSILKLWLGTPGRFDGTRRCRGRRISVSVNGAPPEEIRVLPGALAVLVPPSADEDPASGASIRHRPVLLARPPAGPLREAPPARADRSRSTRAVDRDGSR